MTKRILITGGSGFVGRKIMLGLKKKGLNLTAVLRENSESANSDHLSNDNIVVTQNLFQETPEWWEYHLRGVDTVIHAAWYAEPGKYLHSDLNLECLQGTLNLAKGAADAGIRRFIGIGTCLEYNLQGGLLSTETPLNPTTPYAATKAATFFALSQLLPARGVGFLWCRLFHLFGDGEDGRRLVPFVRTKLAAGEPVELTRGEQIRDFLDVAKAGQMIADLSLSDRLGPVNICSGEPITVRQLAERIADEYGRRDLLKFGAHAPSPSEPPSIVGKPYHNQ
jgi:dTDP-6-deoxy-L-talose 4-dehydrogenase (NAD+)